MRLSGEAQRQDGDLRSLVVPAVRDKGRTQSRFVSPSRQHGTAKAMNELSDPAKARIRAKLSEVDDFVLQDCYKLFKDLFGPDSDAARLTRQEAESRGVKILQDMTQ